MACRPGQVLLWDLGDARRVGRLDDGSVLSPKEVPLSLLFSVVGCATRESAHATSDHRFKRMGAVGCASDHGRRHGRVYRFLACGAFVQI